MVSRRTRVASWIFRRDHPSRPKAMICCFFSSFKTFAMLREATYPPAAVNVLDASSESMAAFQVFLYGRFWVFTEASCWLDRPNIDEGLVPYSGFWMNCDWPAAVGVGYMEGEDLHCQTPKDDGVYVSMHRLRMIRFSSPTISSKRCNLKKTSVATKPNKSAIWNLQR